MDALQAPPDWDDEQNNLMAAGAILMILWMIGRPQGVTSIEAVADGNGNATNQIDVSFSFLKSAYRLTVERVVD